MPKRKKLKPIPRLKSEAEERVFWESHDTSDYVDWDASRIAYFPNLKTSIETDSEPRTSE